MAAKIDRRKLFDTDRRVSSWSRFARGRRRIRSLWLDGVYESAPRMRHRIARSAVDSRLRSYPDHAVMVKNARSLLRSYSKFAAVAVKGILKELSLC
jgi:hypothetical protein